MDRVLLLIPTTSYRVDDFMAAAAALGAKVVVGSDKRQALEEFSGGATITVSFRDLDEGVRRIVAHAHDHPFHAVIGVDEETTLLAARASEALGLPHNPPQAVAAAGNKDLMRRAFADAGLPSPAFALVAVADDPAASAASARYPCVLKPLALSGSRGVIRADDPASFAAAFHRIKRILETSRRPVPAGAAGQILVEDYIPGAEVALEGLLRDGRLEVLALFDKPDPLEGPHFEETIYLTPSRLEAGDRQAIADAAARAAAALGLRHGPVHAELRLNQAGPWIIEVAARSIGGLCSRVLDFGAGMSLEQVILGQALSRPVAAAGHQGGPAGVMMIPIPGRGTLRRIEGLDAARAVAGVTDIRITIPSGQEVVPLPEGDRYLGFIFAKGETADAVEASLRAAHKALAFVIEPAAGPAAA